MHFNHWKFSLVNIVETLRNYFACGWI